MHQLGPTLRLVSGLLLGALAACSGGEDAPAASSSGAGFESGHERMVAKLAEIADEMSGDNQFLGQKRLRFLRRQLRTALATPDATPLTHWRIRYDLGPHELNRGNNEEAIRLLTEAHLLLPQVDFENAKASIDVKDVRTFYSNMTRLNLATAYLRLAETENCYASYNAESCILPFRGKGRHEKRRGSRQAIKYLLEILENRPAYPDMLERMECEKTALWLLNIANMTLGRYPDGVPPEYLVDMGMYESDVDMPLFKNIGPELGIDTFNLGGGAIVDDFDGDDYLDIMTSAYDPREHMRYFRNEGDGTFSDRTEEAGLLDILGGINLIQADYDNDGDLDVFALRGAWFGELGRHPNSLLRNDGSGHFTDVTFAAGLGEVHYPCKSGAWADYDLDGDLDLYVGNESTPGMIAPAQLFRNNGDGTFSDVAEEAGMADPLFANGTNWGDVDGDRYPDLFVNTGFSNPLNVLEGGGPNRLYHNNGDGTFTEMAEEAGVVEPVAGFPCWFWDFDNDGNLDLFASCSSGPVATLVWPDVRVDMDKLYRGDGQGHFTDVSEEFGLTLRTQPMGANFGDLNNDGYPDYFLGTGNIQYTELRPNVMYLNDGGRRFLNITLDGGFGHLQKGHGISFADLDNDGDCDVYAQMGGAWPADGFNDALFENPGFGNHSLTVVLVGQRSNRSAIGARIRCDILDGDERRSVFRHVTSGGSFGCNPLRQTIGLGTATSIERLEVYWPASDTTQVFENVAVDRAVRIIEGDERLIPIEVARLRLGG